MSKDNKLQLLSPLFLKYQTDFEKNPRSRVFAPLAEAYRKLGMTDKAMEILAQGIRFHPTYVMGYLGLAFCYFDIKQFNLAYSTLRPLVESNRDNLRLQKLFADICLELDRQEEALETLKYLLFINPRDKVVAEMVTRLESEIESKYRPQHKPIVIAESEFEPEAHSPEQSLFEVEKLEGSKVSLDFDDWMALDFSKEKKKSDESKTNITPMSALNYDDWNVKKNTQVAVEKTPAPVLAEVNEVHSAKEKKEPVISLDLHADKEEAPIITHTLVDLYCGQGHIEKAIEVLEKILILNPNDQRTIQKLNEIKALLQPAEPMTENLTAQSETSESNEINEEPFYQNWEEENEEHEQAALDLTELQETSEEDGRRHLMSLIDEKLSPIEIEEEHAQAESKQSERAALVTEKLNLFLKKIQKRALEYQSRV